MYAARLGHVQLRVRQLDAAVDFYTRVLGLRVVERVGDQYAFLTGGAAHHELALQQVGPHAPLAGQAALHHLAFEVPDRAALAHAYEVLTAEGQTVTAVDHRISWTLYFADPDGNGLALFWDTRGGPGGAVLWRGRNQALSLSRLLGE
jgi:catechol 2,3-dioxygenase